MTNAEKMGFEKLKERADRLKKLLSEGIPPIFIAKEILLLFDSAMLYCPKELLGEQNQRQISSNRTAFGFCEKCDAFLHDNREHLCPKCQEDINLRSGEPGSN